MSIRNGAWHVSMYIKTLIIIFLGEIMKTNKSKTKQVSRHFDDKTITIPSSLYGRSIDDIDTNDKWRGGEPGMATRGQDENPQLVV